MPKFASKQAYYDEIVKRYRDGRLPAMTEGGHCFYRKGNKAGARIRCVAGLCIPPNKYNRNIEGVDVARNNPGIFAWMPDDMDINTLQACQRMHDRSTGGALSINDRLRQMASVLGVTPQEI